MSQSTISIPTIQPCSAESFLADVQFLAQHWRRIPVGNIDVPLIDLGTGEPLVFVPILEQLEFVYARQMQAFSQTRRVLLYQRHETRTRFTGMSERVEELRGVLDALDITASDFVAHGDAAMVLFEFALRYPERCRSLTIIAQGADYQIAPHPFIWWLHELFLRLPIEHLIPAFLLRRIVLRYITHADPTQKDSADLTALPRHLIESQFRNIKLWPAVYRYSVLPVIHSFDIRTRVTGLTMPVLLINRYDDLLSPLEKTDWLAQHLPNCAGYHILPGRERFFLYSQAERVTPLIEAFLTAQSQKRHAKRSQKKKGQET